MIVDGILWILRTGVPWRDLPEAFGPWATVWDLFDTWNTLRSTGFCTVYALRKSIRTPSIKICGASMAPLYGPLVALRAAGKKPSGRSLRPRLKPFSWWLFHEDSLLLETKGENHRLQDAKRRRRTG